MKFLECTHPLFLLLLIACAGGQTAIRVGPVGVILPDKNTQLEKLPEIPEQKVYSILRPGSFHGEDIPEMENTGWIGLFVEGEKSFIDSVDLTITPVRDNMLDSEGEMSGKKIDADPNGALYFIQGLSLGECSMMGQNINALFPGETHSFDYFGRHFTLKATAATIGEDGDFNSIRDYQLILSTEMNGREEFQVLASAYQFDDAQMSVLFIGDLDRDGWPDLIVNTSPKYSYSEISLFLSGPADSKDLVRHVATFRSTGC